eukprot:443422_1
MCKAKSIWIGFCFQIGLVVLWYLRYNDLDFNLMRFQLVLVSYKATSLYSQLVFDDEFNKYVQSYGINDDAVMMYVQGLEQEYSEYIPTGLIFNNYARSKICLISMMDKNGFDENAQSLFKHDTIIHLRIANFMYYSLLHNYSLIIFNETFKYSTLNSLKFAHYSKPFYINYVLNQFKHFQWIIWIDFDTIFNDCRQSLHAVIHNHQRINSVLDMIITMNPRQNTFDANTGVIFFRNCQWTNYFVQQWIYLIDHHLQLKLFDIHRQFTFTQDQPLFNLLLAGFDPFESKVHNISQMQQLYNHYMLNMSVNIFNHQHTHVQMETTSDLNRIKKLRRKEIINNSTIVIFHFAGAMKKHVKALKSRHSQIKSTILRAICNCQPYLLQNQTTCRNLLTFH